MKKAILGTKIGMTQIFLEDGRAIPVTVVQAGPCKVVQIKTEDRDGYAALQVGYGELTEQRAKKLKNKPERGHFAKASIIPMRKLRELRLDDCSGYEIGQEIKAEVFEAGDRIDVSGTSKGHGTQGPIRRWNQSRGPVSHGSKYHRGPGSMGAGSDPSKVFKNKHMAGRMGNEKVTLQNLEVVRVDAERNLLLIYGNVPGPNGGMLFIRDSVKAR